jgi:hypothetical protein
VLSALGAKLGSRVRFLDPLEFSPPIKIGGKRFSLAATGIDFNRILLSA